jgi:hypothetical protein
LLYPAANRVPIKGPPFRLHICQLRMKVRFNSFSKAIVAPERLREMRKSAAIMPAHK